MIDKISFLILTHQGAASRQLVTTKKMVKTISLTVAGFLLVGLVAAVYMFYDYRHLNKTVAEMKMMEALVISQQEEIVDQREEIQNFAKKINGLNENLSALKRYEEKVRKIAGIKAPTPAIKKDDEIGKTEFGVGGPLPEDVHTDIELNKKHSRLISDMHEQVDQLKRKSNQQSDEIQDLLNRLMEKQKRLACTPSIRPVRGQTTSKFGYRQSEFTKKRELHKGYDIGAPRGTQIVATADGKIRFAGREGSFGKMIVIDHGYGYKTRYAHASKLLKKKGDQVKKGEAIALVGSTGRSTGSHVHYEVLKKGVPVNPKKFFLN